MTDRSKQSVTDKQSKTEKSPSSSEQKEFAARRTVIQGIASVAPVIMTLSSGEALANSSSLQCIKEPPYQPPKCITKYQTDEWLRKYVSYDSKYGTVTKKCLKYVDQSGEFCTEKEGYPVTRSCYNSFIPKK